MNTLNSIILEGKIVSRDVNVSQRYKKITVHGLVVVQLETSRYVTRLDGSKEEEYQVFDVLVDGNLAEHLTNHCEIGRGLRVVGRLSNEKYTDSHGKRHATTCVFAEHIEYKPFVKQEGK